MSQQNQQNQQIPQHHPQKAQVTIAAQQQSLLSPTSSMMMMMDRMNVKHPDSRNNADAASKDAEDGGNSNQDDTDLKPKIAVPVAPDLHSLPPGTTKSTAITAAKGESSTSKPPPSSTSSPLDALVEREKLNRRRKGENQT
jgi:hypothetical protein